MSTTYATNPSMIPKKIVHRTSRNFRKSSTGAA